MEGVDGWAALSLEPGTRQTLDRLSLYVIILIGTAPDYPFRCLINTMKTLWAMCYQPHFLEQEIEPSKG